MFCEEDPTYYFFMPFPVKGKGKQKQAIGLGFIPKKNWEHSHYANEMKMKTGKNGTA
jgi:hypothetical protein